jgi:hypothetical protein
MANEVILKDGGILPVTDDEVFALRHAAWHAQSRTHGAALISLLRKLDPEDETLRLMDRQARRQGYVRAGSDELLTETQPQRVGQGA